LARKELGLSSSGYGVLLGFLGTGSVIGANLLPRLRARFSLDAVVTGATVLFAAATFCLASIRSVPVLYGVMLFGGMAWIGQMSNLMVAAQTVVPAWVRARAIAVYLLVFQGGMAIGSGVWGVVASHLGIATALHIAGFGLLFGLLTMVRFRLVSGEELDLQPSMHWPEPELAIEPEPEHGPVLITVEYRIDPERSQAFAETMWELRALRLRDGAMRWGLWHDTAAPGRYIETFVVSSWLEHLRQHERVTVADREVEERAFAFHNGDVAGPVSHYISAYTYDTPSEGTWVSELASQARDVAERLVHS